MTLATLVTGPTASAREAAIAAAIEPGSHVALILEGLPGNNTELDSAASAADLRIVRIAPGCLCCIGQLTMRVTLNRILRNPPPRLFIALSSSDHLHRLRAWLAAPPYDNLLRLTKDLHG